MIENNIKNVIICGLGAVGLTYAVKLKDKCNLKILVDEKRLKKLKLNPPVFNNKKYQFEYILPNANFNADLIIIATKSNGLNSAIEYIKNFVQSDTIILSLLNGISSEEIIQKVYQNSTVVKSYFIGHSAVRKENCVTQDGIGEIVMASNQRLEGFFDSVCINYSVKENIDYDMWLKFTMNIFSNQTSAILNMTFGELKQNNQFLLFAKNIIKEVKQIAEKKGITNLENLEKDALQLLSRMCDEGKTSMLQDVLDKRKTEVDIFAAEIIRLGKEYGILTPYNQVLFELIKIIEEKNEHSVYTC